jgi:hypothetical protein
MSTVIHSSSRRRPECGTPRRFIEHLQSCVCYSGGYSKHNFSFPSTRDIIDIVPLGLVPVLRTPPIGGAWSTSLGTHLASTRRCKYDVPSGIAWQRDVFIADAKHLPLGAALSLMACRVGGGCFFVVQCVDSRANDVTDWMEFMYFPTLARERLTKLGVMPFK